MAFEPQQRVVEWLKAYADKRRKAYGPPMELHPATRRMLQAEAARIHRPARPEASATRGRRAGWWVRWAWSGAIFAGLAAALWVVDHAPRQPADASASRRSQAPAPNPANSNTTTSELQLAKNEPVGGLTNTRLAEGVLVPESAPAKPVATMAPGAAVLAAKPNRSEPGEAGTPVAAASPRMLARDKAAAAAPDPMPPALPAPRVVGPAPVVPSALDAPRRDRAQQEPDLLENRQKSPATTAVALAAESRANLPPVARPAAEAPMEMVAESPVAGKSVKLSPRYGLAKPKTATRASTQAAPAPESTVAAVPTPGLMDGSRSGGSGGAGSSETIAAAAAMGAARGRGPDAMVVGRESAPGGEEIGAVTVQQTFRFQPVADSPAGGRRSVAPARFAASGPAFKPLQSFGWERAGNRLRITDSDGSIYMGLLDAAGPDKSLGRITASKAEAPASAAAVPGASPADADSTARSLANISSDKVVLARTSDSKTSSNLVASMVFQAAGTNLTLGQRVELRGVLSQPAPAATAGASQGGRQRNSTPNARSLTNRWQVQGQATVNGDTLEFRAIQMP
jgi:hypothetical protein